MMNTSLLTLVLATCLLAGAASGGTDWQTELLLVNGGIGSDTNLIIDDAGVLHTSFEFQHAFLPGSDLYYASKANVTAPWVVQTVQESTFLMYGNGNDMALDAQGRPHIAFGKDDDFSFTSFVNYAAFNGTSWEATTITVTGDNPQEGDTVGVDSTGRVHVAYGTEDFSEGLVHRSKAAGGTTFDKEFIDVPGRTSYAKMAVDGDDLHVAYYHRLNFGSTGELHVASRSGGTWAVADVDSLVFNTPGLDLALDSAGNPHVVYSVFVTGQTTIELKHAWTDGNQWFVEDLDTIPGNQNWHSSIAIGDDDKIHVSFSRWITNVDRHLVYMCKEGGVWSSQVAHADGTNFQAWNTSIDVDATGAPHIIFYERVSGETRHSWLPQPPVPFVDLGSALAGTYGAPQLTGDGVLAPNTPINLSLGNALENTTAWLALGVTAINASFKGGVLVPDIAPPGTVIPLPTSPTGTIDIADLWPPGLPAGVPIYFQYWVEDGAGPVGFAASNALQGVTS